MLSLECNKEAFITHFMLHTPAMSSMLPDMCNLGSLRKGLRVLVVDGSTDSIKLLATLFREYEVETLTATCASEAIALIEQAPPDVLISEIVLPGEDGYSLIKKVKGLESARNNQIPAIALTVFARESDRVQALAAGFCEHLSKPLNIDELIATIASITDQNRELATAPCS